MSKYSWFVFRCPPEWRVEDFGKIDKITALMKKHKGKFEGSFKYETFNLVYRFKISEAEFDDRGGIDWDTYKEIESQLIKLIKSWGKKITDRFLNDEDRLHHEVIDETPIKPRQLWTPKERAAEKAQKQSTSNVVGQVFTYLQRPQQHDIIGCAQVVIFLSEKRGWFKTLTLDMNYDGLNQNIRAKSWSRSEIKESFEKGWLIQQDLEFLVKFGSPAQVLLKAIQEHMSPYQQALNILEPAPQPDPTEPAASIVEWVDNQTHSE